MQVEKMLISADLSRKRRSEVIDKLAATIILQSAMDLMRSMAITALYHPEIPDKEV